jgi:AcrR family transcriptional regulator
MGPVRREQICRATAAVIAREGFSGTTMRTVAAEAGVSTGMLNHYFASRQDLLIQTLVYVSKRSVDRYNQAIAGLRPGRARLAALLDSVLGGDPEGIETWRVWIAAYGEAVRVPQVRDTLEERLVDWFALLDHGLEGLVAAERPPGNLPWAVRLDAILKGIAMQALLSPPSLRRGPIGEEIAHMVLDGGEDNRHEHRVGSAKRDRGAAR